jgi:HemY protein
MRRRVIAVVLALAALAALILGAWLGPKLLDDPGFVVIEIAGWRVQTSLLVLAAAVIGLWLLASLVIWLVRLPGRGARAARAARSRRNLDRGLLALTEGDWATAERKLNRALRGRTGITAGYLAAARAAQGNGAPERRDRYLALADRRFGQRHVSTALVRARLLAAEGESEQALDLLERIHLKHPRHQGVLRLLLECYQACDRWRDVRLLLPALRKAAIVDRSRADELAQLAAGRELEAAADVEELLAIRRSLRAGVADRREVVVAFARRTLELDRPELAEPALRNAIEEQPDAELLALYAQADADDRDARIRHCERWLGSQGDSADLHLALGRLHLDQRDDEKAREHLQIAVRHSPDPGAYAALGRVLDRAGLLESATQCYRNALRLEQGRAPEPLALPRGAPDGDGPTA